MKNKYERLDLSSIPLTFETALLAGSVTSVDVAVAKKVTVQDFTYGFGDDTDEGFDVEFGN